MVNAQTSHRKNKKMTLEKLANELLLELFEYLEASALFQAFHGLNIRFNTLLLNYQRDYCIDSHSILRYRSSFLSRHHLLRIVDQTVSLRLAYNNDESSKQIDFFFTCGLRLNQFIHLRSISLCYITTEELLRRILNNCHQFPELIHLKVVQCHSSYMSSENFSNRIWSLSSLTHCRLDMKDDFCIPTRISSFIQYVSISCACWPLSNTAALFRQTPCLQRLHTPLNYLNDKRNQMLPSHRFLTILKLSDVRSSHSMTTILQAAPNLTHLKVDSYYIIYNGYQWERVIENCLPNLKIFRLRMNLQFGGEKNNEQHVLQFVDSFRTPFWLQKHQWFIRYNHTSHTEYQSVLLHTIPYGFSDFSFSLLSPIYKSTCLRDNDYSAYENVNNLSHLSFITRPPFPIRFPNVRNLNIELPFNTSFWQYLPMLNQLKSLSVYSKNKNASLHLQSLLDRAPYLYSLKIISWPTNQVPATQNTSSSLRRLDLLLLQKPLSRDRGSYSREQCETLIQSSLGMQCEELLIPIQNRESTLDLIKKMPHLRILCVKFPFHATARGSYYGYRDDVVHWLQHKLPSTCTISTFSEYGGCLTIWIFANKS